MNKNQRRKEQEDNLFIKEVTSVAERLTPNFIPIEDSDDFIRYYVAWVWARPELRQQYTVVALVNASIRQRAVDFVRMMGRQNPEGGYDSEKKRVRNKVAHLDDVISESEEGDLFTLADVVANTLAEGKDICEVLCVNERLEEALSVLSPNQRAIFVLVEGHGHKVAEVARAFGVRREWASKQLSAARRILGVRKGSLK
jgi:RNA polymerase sigma factor (sigma-70 family)